MKKVLLAVLMTFLMAGIAYADYSVTVTWTLNGQLKNEKVFLDGVEKCDVLAADPATCTFMVTDLTGQAVTAQAFNTQGTGSAIYEMGTLLTIPEPPTGAVFTITHIP
jgi:hypothetical protein